MLLTIGTFTFGDDLGIDEGVMATLGDLILLFFLFVVFLGPFLVAMVLAVLGGLFGRGTGWTPGRATLGLRVVDADDGEPARLRAALHGFLRHLPTVLLFIGFAPVWADSSAIPLVAYAGALLLVADLLVMLTRDDHRAVHDVLAGVTVVRAQPAS